MSLARPIRRRPGAVGSPAASLLLAACLGVLAAPGAAAETQAYLGGRWFDGVDFVERDVWSVDGLLTDSAPATIDRVLDLSDRWVVPPFGEAHNHNAEGARPAWIVDRYLAEGIFYVKNPDVVPRSRAAVLPAVNRPDSIDVAFAPGALTGPGGHPWGLIRRNTEAGIFTEEDGEGGFVHSLAARADLERLWPALLAQEPDFVKVYLLYSERPPPSDPEERFGWKGLDPALLPEIVERAHLAGLPVSAHVESATDFRNAIAAGVDEIAHLPGFRLSPATDLPDPRIYRLTEEDARQAAERGVVVVTTVGATGRFLREQPRALREPGLALLEHNLQVLRAGGVTLAVGSDVYRDTARSEADFLHELGIFDNVELLRMWSSATPRAIFPRRRVGCLDAGCEASFLALRANPIAEWSATREIELRVKSGRVLGTADAPPGGRGR